MSKETTALVVGKFAPLHVGHQFLIETAIQTADHVVVLCWSNPDFTFADSATRASCIQRSGLLFLAGHPPMTLQTQSIRSSPASCWLT